MILKLSLFLASTEIFHSRNVRKAPWRTENSFRLGVFGTWNRINRYYVTRCEINVIDQG